jgi:hypothetical protein
MSSILTPFLYSLLPSQTTTLILPYLTTSFPSLFPPSQPGTPQYRRNYQITYTLLVGGYLGYTLINDLSLGVGMGRGGGGRVDGEDWYALLGVKRSVDEDGLKRAFRTL